MKKRITIIQLALAAFAVHVIAQTGTNADVEAVKQLIQCNPADLAMQMKPYYMENRRTPANIVEFGRTFIEAKDMTNAHQTADKVIRYATTNTDDKAESMRFKRR